MTHKGHVVEVEWVDAQWIADDSTPDEWFKKDFLVYTFGLCVRDTKKYLVVSHEHNCQGVYRGVTTIPKPCIKIVRSYGRSNSRNGSSDS